MEEKVSLTIKTKIAAWWMKIIGFIVISISIVGIGFCIFLSLQGPELALWIMLIPFLLIPLFLGGCVSSFLGSRILKKEKIFWWISIVIILIGVLSCIGGFIFYYSQEGLFEEGFFSAKSYYPIYFLNLTILIVLLVPLILLLLDRKNFFKVAT